MKAKSSDTDESSDNEDSKMKSYITRQLKKFMKNAQRKMMTPTTMMMTRMEMLALPMLIRCLLDTLTLCHSLQKGEVVLDMRVVILIGGGLV